MKTYYIGLSVTFWTWISISSCMNLTVKQDLSLGEAETPQLNYYVLGVPAILAFQVATLRLYGQPWIATSAHVDLWAGDIHGPDNSQQVSDWYTFNHVLHGFVLHYATGLLPVEDVMVRFLMSLTAECGWELLENSPFVIEKYRHTTLARGYLGDTVINSLSDNIAMGVGFWMAHFIPSPIIIAMAVMEEIILAAEIRDNLVLNIIQFVYPMDFISQWQAESLTMPNNSSDISVQRL